MTQLGSKHHLPFTKTVRSNIDLTVEPVDAELLAAFEAKRKQLQKELETYDRDALASSLARHLDSETINQPASLVYTILC